LSFGLQLTKGNNRARRINTLFYNTLNKYTSRISVEICDTELIMTLHGRLTLKQMRRQWHENARHTRHWSQLRRPWFLRYAFRHTQTLPRNPVFCRFV